MKNLIITSISFLIYTFANAQVGTSSLNAIVIEPDSNGNYSLLNQTSDGYERWLKIIPSENKAYCDINISNQSDNYPLYEVDLYLTDLNNYILESRSELYTPHELISFEITPSNTNFYFIKLKFSPSQCSSCNETIYDVQYNESRPMICPPSLGTCNMLENGSFEQYPYTCPGTGTNVLYGMGKMELCYWGANRCSPTATAVGTGDYFNNCWAGVSQTVSPNFFSGANTGNAAIGLFLYATTSPTYGLYTYREYVHSLIRNPNGSPIIPTPLQINQVYQISMYAKNMNHALACRELQVLLTPIPTCQIGHDVINPAGGQLIGMSQSAITNTVWTRYTVQFQASGNHQYITIGNFMTNANTTTVVNSSSTFNNPWPTSYYNIDDVELITSSISMPSPVYVPCGTTTLQLSPTNCELDNTTYSYSWLPTTGLSNPNILNPVITVNGPIVYTVTQTGIGAFGIVVNTTTVQLIPNSGPTATLSAFPAFFCTGSQSPTITVNGNNALSYSWSPISSSSNSIVVTPTTSTVYSVTITYSACVVTQTIFVGFSSNCCGSSYPSVGTTSSSANTNIFNSVFNLDYTVSPGTSVGLTSGEIIFAPNTKLVVENNGTLTISNCHLFACQTMWTGIVVKPGGRLIMNNSLQKGPLIEDAIIAVDCSNLSASLPGNATILDITNTIFNKNFIGIKISNYTVSTSPYPFNIHSNVFTSRQLPVSATSWPQTGLTNNGFGTNANLRAGGNSLNTLNSPYLQNFNISNLKAPYSTYKSNTAIYVEKVGAINIAITIGSAASSSNFNLFDTHSSFISALNSNVNSYNNTFQNTIQNPAGSSLPVMRSAIKFINDYTSSNFLNNKLDLYSPQNSNSAINRFFNCHVGIESKNTATLIVRNAYFSSNQSKLNTISPSNQGYYGIYIEGNRYYNHFINGNQFANIANCVKVSMNSNMITANFTGQVVSTFSVSNNLFCPATSTASSIGNEFVQSGVWIENTAPAAPLFSVNPSNGFRIAYNNFYKVWNGIKINGFTGTNYNKTSDNNVIYLEPNSASTLPQSGIEYVNVPKGIINSNIVIGFGTSTTSINSGILCKDSQTLTVHCNSVSVLNRGFEFYGNDKYSSWKVNTMQTNYSGMYASNWGLTSTGGIGMQGGTNNPADNLWIGSNVWQTLIEPNNTNVSSSKIYNRTIGTGYNMTSSANGPISQAFTSYNNGTFRPTTGGTSSAICPGNNSGGNCLTCANREWVDVALDETTLSDPTAEINQFILFQNLKIDSALANSNDTLSDFFQANLSGALGTLSSIEDALVVGDISFADNLLTSFEPESNVQANYKNYLVLYRNSLLDSILSYNDSTALSLLSLQCPIVDGPSVFMARILRNHLYKLCDEYLDEDCAPEGFSSRPSSNSNSSNINDFGPLKRNETLTSQIVCRLYPNPSNSRFNIETNLPIEQGYAISDVYGRIIVVDRKRLPAGKHEIDLKPLRLSEGLYLLHIYYDQKIKQTKKILLHD